TFGNLTLLTSALNSSVSNGPFSAKGAAITKQSAMRLNTYFQGLDKWDEAAILERGKALLATAIVEWPHPTSSVKLAGKPVDAKGSVKPNPPTPAKPELNPGVQPTVGEESQGLAQVPSNTTVEGPPKGLDGSEFLLSTKGASARMVRTKSGYVVIAGS